MWQNVKNTYQCISGCPILRHFWYEIQIVEVQKEHASVEASPELFCSVSSACPSDFRGCLILFCRHSFTVIHSLSPFVKKRPMGETKPLGGLFVSLWPGIKCQRTELDRLRVDTFRWFSDFGIPNHFYLSSYFVTPFHTFCVWFTFIPSISALTARIHAQMRMPCPNNVTYMTMIQMYCLDFTHFIFMAFAKQRPSCQPSSLQGQGKLFTAARRGNQARCDDKTKSLSRPNFASARPPKSTIFYVPWRPKALTAYSCPSLQPS